MTPITVVSNQLLSGGIQVEDHAACKDDPRIPRVKSPTGSAASVLYTWDRPNIVGPRAHLKHHRFGAPSTVNPSKMSSTQVQPTVREVSDETHFYESPSFAVHSPASSAQIQPANVQITI